MRPQPDFLHEFVRGKSDRTLLLLHGTGGNERDLIPLGREIDPDASLLSPRGKILENGMPRFFRRLAEGVFDLEDLKTRTNELADFVAAAVHHYKLAAEHIVGVGYSNGANIAASMIEIAGPDQIRQDEVIRQYLSATGDARKVVTDAKAGYFGIAVNDQSLVPGDNPRLGPTHYNDWLKRSTA